MYKYRVITINTHTNIFKDGVPFTETEYPKLNEYLEQGYVVKDTIPIVKPADASYSYSITFILVK